MSQLDNEAYDPALEAVYDDLRNRDPDGSLLAEVFRSTFDQLYDGQRTGRYRVDQLHKTEKTHFGTLIEINIQRKLNLADGNKLDFTIAGSEVDCKYSHTGEWMLPLECFEEIILVTQASDLDAVWSAGLIRATASNRRQGANRDRKTGLTADGRLRVKWLFKDAPMPPNALLQLPRDTVEEIMAGKSGQSRVNLLLERATNIRLTRNIIATVAQQQDYMKRVRENGGARGVLRAKGYLILSGDYSAQRSLAALLGAAIPNRGELVSVRVIKTDQSDGVEISGHYWRLAASGEVSDSPAPLIKNQ